MGKKLSALSKKPTVAVSATYFVGYDSSLSATYTWPSSALQTIAWAQSANYGVDKINSIFTTVNSNSAINWNYQGTDVKNLTANYENVSTTVKNNSAQWAIDTDNVSVNNFVFSNSATILNVDSVVQTNSANWNYQGTDVKLLTGNWQNTYATFGATSSTFIINGTSVAQSIMIGGYDHDPSMGSGSMIGGGSTNSVHGHSSGTIGGADNAAHGNQCFIGGGELNVINSGKSAILGGTDNTVTGGSGGIIGGQNNNISDGNFGFIGGGEFNTISSNRSTILGGANNNIPVGKDNVIILGSDITASQSDMTYVSNLSSVGNVYSDRGNSVEWNDCRTTVKNNSATWYDPKLVTSTTLNFPFIASVKNISLLTTGAPADIASITLPSWLTRYAITGSTSGLGGAPISRVIVESRAGDIGAASIFGRKESYTPANSADSTLGLTSLITGLAAAGTSKGINTLYGSTSGSEFHSFLTGSNIYITQSTNSGAAGTISVYFYIVPFI